MDDNTKRRIETWLNGAYDQEIKDEIKRMQQEDPKALEDAFYCDLEFGTGGMRGIIGVGTNRMNKYTVGAAAQGIANFMKATVPHDPRIVISYDSRIMSREFAQISADIFSANGIQTFLFDDIRPTPELSFAVRELHCQAGVMITASHNPKEYNGYKVYGDDGGQLVAPYDRLVLDEVKKVTDISMISWQRKASLVKVIGKKIDDIYLKHVRALSLHLPKSEKGKNLKIVYTPLHGTGIALVPQALKMFGFKDVTVVAPQAIPDGTFPTVVYPNPEEHEALKLALQCADEIHADLVLATDPDADRVGIAVRNADGEMQLMNGNQTATLLFNYVLEHQLKKGHDIKNPYVVKTIVTTDLLKDIALDYNIDCYEVLTGFKYIAETIRSHEQDATYLVGGEESYGYLVGDFVRDKDAVSACCLIAEMAACYKVIHRENHKLLTEVLDDIYYQYGLYQEGLLSLTKKGQDGLNEIRQMMEKFRTKPPKTIGGIEVVKMHDVQLQKYYDYRYGTNGPLDLPSSNVLQFFLKDGSKLTVRPSGTEPKIKFYFSVTTKVNRRNEMAARKLELQQKIEDLKKAMLEF
ncbi:MAG: phospho-sugar mutase [Bacteroidales bacterium]|nr:phospho-sugar mutase [Bacteroidales bacterium]